MRRSIGPSIGNDDSEIDRVLSREDEILPSSGFTISVMDAVRSEATAPLPIPFPWKRVLPGLLVVCAALALILGAVVKAIAQLDRTKLGSIAAPHFSTSLPSAMPTIFKGGIESAAIWTALALLMAFISVKLSMRLSGQA